MQRAWVMICVAVIFEISWAVSLKKNQSWTHLGWSAVSVVALIPILILLSAATKTIPLGTTYAVFTALGTAGTLLVGTLFLSEPLTWQRSICFLFILIGVVGLKLAE